VNTSPSWILPASAKVGDIGLDSLDAQWCGGTVRQSLNAAALAAGLSGSGDADVITLTAGAVATAAALRGFIAASEQVPGDVLGRLAGPSGAWCDDASFGTPARLVRLRGGGSLTPERVAAATLIEVPVKKPRSIRVPLANTPGGAEVALVLADEVLCSTHTHAGLLWANLLALPPTLWGQLVGQSVVLGLARMAWAVLRTRSLDPFVVAGRLNRVERGARIHPSAVVEACWVQAGAEIGPGAVVRGCIVGPGARVEAQTFVGFSVLGAGSCVQRMGWMSFSLLHAGAAHAGAMQLGVLGPDAAVKGGAVLMDQGVGQAVRVLVDGELRATPLGMMGVGVGRESVVGSGVWVAPGRTIPPQLTVLPPASDVLTRVDAAAAPGVYQIVGGGLERVR